MSAFRDDRTGNYLTQSLFLELTYDKPDAAIYTLKDADYEHNGKTYVSIKRLYLEIADPTEYEFATTCLGGWGHWKRLCTKTTNLHPHIEEWREELEIKLRSQGVKGMIHEATSMGKSAVAASKWLADKGWVKSGVGRPAKKERDAEKARKDNVKSHMANDLKRVRDANSQ
jgi:hypothetical protein